MGKEPYKKGGAVQNTKNAMGPKRPYERPSVYKSQTGHHAPILEKDDRISYIMETTGMDDKQAVAAEHTIERW